MKNSNSPKPMNSKQKTLLIILSYIISGLFFLFGLTAVIPGFGFLNIPAGDALQWFIFSLVVLLVPYVNEVSFKDFNLKMKQFNETKREAEKVVQESKTLRDSIVSSRKELVSGYLSYLESLPRPERYEKVKIQNGNYLKEMNYSVADIEKWLKKAGYYQKEPTNEISEELIDAIASFQGEKGLAKDGIFGYFTLEKLREALEM